MAYDYYWPVVFMIMIAIITITNIITITIIVIAIIIIIYNKALQYNVLLVQGYTFDLDLNTLKSLGVPAEKIVYGIMPGHSDAREYTCLLFTIQKYFLPPILVLKIFFLETQTNICSANEYTSIEDAVSVADFVIANGLAGAMTWDVNRDCR